MPNLVDIISNYFERGYRFHKFEPDFASQTPKAVFLIHGWGVRAASMENLAYALSDLDFTVFNYDYPSSEKTIEAHAQIFLDLYRQTLRREHITRKVLFVTHSMGGLLLRAAMAKMTLAECHRIEAVVMLGPPNRGSALASIGGNEFIRSVNASLGDMRLHPDAYVQHIPAPLYLPPVGIIAGRFDGKVSVKNTSLPEGLVCHRAIVDCTHPGLRDPENTLRAILYFFQKKEFH